ncbi:MAG: TonB-dependent receptor [Bacteroidales bacterium]|nr:TonB-dependent receptor [Bacteroidales bacterium]
MIKNLKTLLSVFMLMIAISVSAQVTNSSISGIVLDENGQALTGATIEAKHNPSGTLYGAVANVDGRFSIQGMRTGGPYTISVSFIGYRKMVINDITLQLGENYNITVDMKPGDNVLDDVVVTAVKTKFAAEKTGATTNISNAQINALPTINRSIADIARVSPYAGSGMSFAGGDGRSTNFTVDGANFNNNFGLTDKLPGGGTPISLDAIEEMQVVIAPYDLRQTNFVGGGLNAVTKSGTNTFKGSAYTYQYNEDMRGNRAGGEDLGNRGVDRKHVYGATLGGPIIKDKLFFFGNFEYQKIPTTATEWRASEDGVADAGSYVSRTTLSDMERVSKHVKEKYGYNTGSWTDFPADESNVKFLARIDWNINRDHKLAVRYNYTKNSYWNAPNGNSNNASFRYRASNRMSAESMSFANSMYSMDNVVHSFSGDLNSRFGSNMSNQLLVTYTSIKDMRGSNSDIFPFVDILGGYEVTADGKINQDPTPYMSLGYELFTYNNGVNNKILTINDNFTYNLGAHKLMAGLSFEHQMANNSYMRNGTGYYRYRSVDDFINGAAPESVAFTIGYNGQTKPSAQVRFNQYGLYLQDEWNVTKNFKLNYGVRFDLLAFNEDDIMTNNAILAVNYGGRHIDTGVWPGSRVNINPRVGFNWDVFGDKSLKVRGGSGLFTGRLPLVFFTNMPTNSGMVQNLVTLTTKYSGYVCDATPTDALNKFAGGMITDVYKMAEVAGAQTTISPEQGAFQSAPCGVDPDFKMPQVWKSSIAVDYQIPVSFPFSVTGEFIYTKNINAVKLDNYNIRPIDETWERFAGSDNRVIYPSDYKYNSDINTACVLTNTNKGYGYIGNITLNAKPTKDLNLMLAYTHTESKEVSGMPGSDANSAWSGLYTIDGPNFATVQRSEYVIPDRIIASVGYDLHETTHLNLFYSCYSPYGYSYYMTNDMNGDGIATDLMYIPKDENDIVWAGTPEQQAQDAKDFWAFVNQDSYLKNHKGEYAEAYGARSPLVHRFDFRIAQDIKFRIGKTNHKIELSFDFINIGNLFNSNWGVAKNMSSCNNGAILNYAGQNAEGKPTFTLYRDKAGNAPTKTWEYNRATSQCWQLQFGARYTF